MSRKAPFSPGCEKGGEGLMLISKVQRSTHLMFARVGLRLAVRVGLRLAVQVVTSHPPGAQGDPGKITSAL